MNRKLERLSAPLLLVACFFLFSALPASARDPKTGPVVIPATYHDVSLPLWQMAIPATPHVGPPHVTLGKLRSNVRPPASVERTDPAGDDPTGRTPVATTDLLNFDGQNADGLAPPDTNGSVGATQFVQWVNVEYNVYDKATGAKILGPIQGSSFWTGFAGPCGNSFNNDGDIIINYDKAAGRWFAAQNVFSTPYTACVAVSTTSDATGTYNRYGFTLQESNSDFPDYPKWGVWPDGYYMSYADFQGGFNLNFFEACAADRTNMLLGNAATMQCFDAPNGDLQGLPADLDGLNPPPAGAPNHYVHLNTAGGSLEQLDFHVDFTNPTNSTFTDKGALQTQPFNLICSAGTNRSCIKQPSGGEGLDSLGDRLMYRNAYRNFGSYESLLDTHTVKPTGTSTAVGAARWYEFRSTPPGGAFRVFQQGTLQTGAISLWMASIAQDKNGDIAIGMSASGTAVDPSVVYTGRVPADKLGTMEGMKLVVKGGGVQQGTQNRWGDYSTMSVDPTDDCTFWFTEEYIKSTGSFNWSTRINSFKFNGCT